VSDHLQVIPADQQARDQALDIARSCIVQAPAGSGKTELLTQRFLKLLAAVDEPEQVLAITFTRAATAEMRKRVLDWLDQAQGGTAANEDNATSLRLARAALLHSQQRQWHLLEQPQRLNIQTIDSLCLSIAHRTPLLARLGGTLQPTEDAEPLYSLAARRTLQRLGGHVPELNAALEALLQVRDNNLRDCETLIADMLRQRDQWQQAFPLSREIDNWEAIRARLEQPFRHEIRRVLSRAHALLSRDAVVARELLELADYACQSAELKVDIGLLAGLRQVPAASEDFVEHWDCLTNLLLTKDHGWRKSLTKDQGFAVLSKGRNSPERHRKDRMLALIDHLQTVPGLLEALCAIRGLPPARYDEQQWQLLRHLFTTLLYAIGELKVVFAEQNVVDFVELGLAAESVLRAPGDSYEETPSDLALALSDQVRHILIDEFQDTSRRQHQLLTSLVRGWDRGDRRTCFLVGDPMQSIYLFRQAEVELFTQLQDRGLDCDGALLELDTLRLTTNFRSTKGVVEPLNDIFTEVFGEPSGSSAVRFTASDANDDTSSTPAVKVHADFVSTALPDLSEEKFQARAREAARVIEIVESHLPASALAAQRGEEYTIAILVRAKKHLDLIAEALRERRIPYRAVELETLNERQEILDLTGLTRALLHPMDRVAWLSVLRAPWCGLTLADLHALAGNDARDTASQTVLNLLESRYDRLSAEGQLRVARLSPVLQKAIELRYRQSASPSFSSWIERTWIALGGPLCVDAVGYENAQAYFRMLDSVSPDGLSARGEALEQQLARLFALPDPETSERCGVQLMTIHKAKGLGFNVVIVPGLERPTTRDRQSLICWLERVPAYEPGAEVSELLVAPVGLKGVKADRLYQWVQQQKERRETEERKRLLYVACTRAKQEVHLLGTATVSTPASGTSIKPGDSQSLLATGWPALRVPFEAEYASLQDAQEAGAANMPLQFPGQLNVTDPVTYIDEDGEGDVDLAASADDILPEDQSPLPPLTVKRLPLNLPEEVSRRNVIVTRTLNAVSGDDAELFQRPEGSREARALGITVHSLFESAAGMLQHRSVEEVRSSIPAWRDRATAILRNSGVALSRIEENTVRALQALEAALSDPHGLWILGPHPQAQTETSWTGWLDNSLRTLRVDRVFRAAAEPLASGEECLWIVDYKTASRDSDVEAFLRKEQEMYHEQLHSYGRVLQLARGGTMRLRLGLYYPLMRRLKYWSA
jgi:ATP-dependent helicase/nuclease subunit A